jgi:hypothetical protein
VQRLSELTGVEEYRFWDTMTDKRKETEAGTQDGSGSFVEKKLVGILINRPQAIEFLKEKGVVEFIKDTNVRELASTVIDYFNDHGSMDLKVFLNVIERPELRDIAISSTMDTAGCDEQEMDKILSDYLQYAKSRLIREEAKGITERLAKAEEQGDEKALRELLQRKMEVVTAMKHKSAK